MALRDTLRSIADAVAPLITGEDAPVKVQHPLNPKVTGESDEPLNENDNEWSPDMRATTHGQHYDGQSFDEEVIKELKDPIKRREEFDQIRRNDSSYVGDADKVERPCITANWHIVKGEPLPDLPSVCKQKEMAKAAAGPPKPGETAEDPHAPSAPSAAPKKELEPAPAQARAKPELKVAPPPAEEEEEETDAAADDADVAEDAEETPPEDDAPADDEDAPADEEETDEEDPEAVEEEPAALTPEEAADLEYADQEHIAVQVMSANLFGKIPEYRMEARADAWTQFLHEMFTAYHIGFSIHERLWEWRTGPYGDFQIISRMAWVHPRSIRKFHLDEKDTLLGITQMATRTWYKLDARGQPIMEQKTEEVFVPAHRLFIYTAKPEGANPEGTPWTRPAYQPIKRRQFVERGQIVDFQRRLIGIPYVRLATDSPLTGKNPAIQQAKRMRGGANETMYVVMRGEEEIGYLDMGANVPNPDVFLRAQKAAVKGVLASEFTSLGGEGMAGSRAVGEVQENHFTLFIEATAEEMRRAIQRGLIEPMYQLNWQGSGIPVPELKVTDVASPDLGPIIDAINAKVLTVDEELESHIRRQLRLPALTPACILKRQRKEELDAKRTEALLQVKHWRAFMPGMPGMPMPMPDQGGQKPESPDKDAPIAARARVPKNTKKLSEPDVVSGETRWRRELKWFETRYMDLAAIQRDEDRTRAALSQDIWLARQQAVKEAVSKAKITGFGQLSIPALKRTDLRDAMGALADGLFERAKARQHVEITKQVQDIVAMDEGAPVALAAKKGLLSKAASIRGVGNKLGKVAALNRTKGALQVTIETNVDAILKDVVASMQKEFLRAVNEGVVGMEAIEAARNAVMGRSPTMADAISREITSQAENGGRAVGAAEARESLKKKGLDIEIAIRTEVRDTETCDECYDLDGKEIRVDSDDYFKYMPPNFCEGKTNCRGDYFHVVRRAEEDEV